MGVRKAGFAGFARVRDDEELARVDIWVSLRGSRAASGGGARWCPSHRCWHVPVDRADAVVGELAALGFRVRRWAYGAEAPPVDLPRSGPIHGPVEVLDDQPCGDDGRGAEEDLELLGDCPGYIDRSMGYISCVHR